MNPKIRELLIEAQVQANTLVPGDSDDRAIFTQRLHTSFEKLAELIVTECADLCDRYQEIPATEPRHCANDIRSMFGIKQPEEEDE